MPKTSDHPDAKLPHKLSGWVQLILMLAALLGLAWGTLKFFNPIKDVDLTVLIKQSIPIDLPVDTETTTLQLNYQGKSINRATIIELKIENTGRTVIKPDNNKQYWNLNIFTKEETKLAQLGKIETNPSIIKYNIEVKTNSMLLQIGKFNPGDFLIMKVILIDSEDPDKPHLYAEATADHLSTPTVTSLSLQKRLQDAYKWPLFIVTYLVIFVLVTRYFKKIGELDWIIKKGVVITNKQKFSNIGGILLVFFGVGYVAYTIALGMSLILAWTVLEAGYV